MIRSSAKLICLTIGTLLLSSIISFVYFFDAPFLSLSQSASTSGMLYEQTDHTAVIPEELFDIDVAVVARDVVKATDLKVWVEFTSFGRVPTKVAITYDILDAQGVVRHTEGDQLTVETERVAQKRFPALALPDGAYTVRVSTLYNTDVRDEFTVPFSINATQSSYVLLFVVLGIFGSAGILLVLYFYVYVRGHRMHVHHLTTAHSISTFVLAGLMIPTVMYLFAHIQKVEAQHATAILFDAEAQVISRADALNTYFENQWASVHALQESLYSEADVHVAFSRLSDSIYTAALYELDANGICMVAAHRINDFAPQACTSADVSNVQPQAGLSRRPNGEIFLQYIIPRMDSSVYVLALSLDDILRDVGTFGRSDASMFLSDENARPIAGYAPDLLHEDMHTQSYIYPRYDMSDVRWMLSLVE